MESFTKNIFNQKQRKQPLDLDIIKNVIAFGAIKRIFDIYIPSLNLKLPRKYSMNRGTQNNVNVLSVVYWNRCWRYILKTYLMQTKQSNH